MFAKITTIAKKFSIFFHKSWYSTGLDPLAQVIQDTIKNFIDDARYKRIQTWRQRLRQSFDVHHHGDAAFAWLRSKPSLSIVAIKDSNDQVTANPVKS